MNYNFFQKSLYALGFVTLVSLGVSAPAQGLTLTQQQSLEEIGGEVNYSFIGPASNGTDGVLNLANAPGSTFDLTTAVAEYFDVIIEGTNIGRYSCTSNPINVIVMDCDGANDLNTFSQDIILQGDALETWLADGLLEVTVDFGDIVDIGRGSTRDFTNTNTLNATLTYNTDNVVPTPAAVLPILSGFFAAARQKKKKDN